MISPASSRTTKPVHTRSEVTPEVMALPLSIVNVYLVGPPGAGDRQWVLVDGGLPTSGRCIEEAAEQRFGPGSRPAAIVLTHGHFDHVGAVRALARRWDAPVYAHRLELPYLTGRTSYPPPDPTVGGGAMAWLSFLYPRGPVDLGQQVHPLPDDGVVPGITGWRWIHTPGHTPGHVSLFREQDRALISGDAFVTTYQESLWAALNQPRHVWRPPAYYTCDWSAARRSIKTLADLHPNVALPGHGQPMEGAVLHEQMAGLVQHFDRIGLPRRGRYVQRPATADEGGPTFVPPALTPRQAMLLLGASACVGLGIGWLMSRRY